MYFPLLRNLVSLFSFDGGGGRFHSKFWRHFLRVAGRLPQSFCKIPRLPRVFPPSFSASPKPHPSKPHPCNMPQAKTEVALQFSECCTAEVALQHSVFCSADVILTKSCAAASDKLHCNIEEAALQESGAFLPLSCGFQAPTFRHPRLGPAELCQKFHGEFPVTSLTVDLKRSPDTPLSLGSLALSDDLSGTESRIANRTIPRIAGPESPEIRSEKQNNESNRSQVENRRKSIQNRHPNRGLQMLKATLESHDSNRTIPENGLRVKTLRVKTSENFSEESNLPRRFRRYPEIL